jgi:ribonucleotide reductase alpha subunit
MKNRIIAANGSIQHITEIPADVKLLHRTVWELKQRAILDMAADRGAYVDQSQSLNVHLAKADYATVSSTIFHAWQIGLKGLYYLRSTPATDAQKFTIDPKLIQEQAARDERSMLSSSDPNCLPLACAATRASSSIARNDEAVHRTAQQIKQERLERERLEIAFIQQQQEARGDACIGGMCSA